MKKRAIVYVRKQANPARTDYELQSLASFVESRGASIVTTYIDDDNSGRRGRYAAWKSLLAHLDGIDQVVFATAADIPGKTIPDLLRVLLTLRSHGVAVSLHREQIDTGIDSGFGLLDLIASFRRAKWSQAIKRGQAAALGAGKRIGRPKVPATVRQRVEAALGDGMGIRPTARRFNVSPASVINIRRSMADNCMEAT